MFSMDRKAVLTVVNLTASGEKRLSGPQRILAMARNGYFSVAARRREKQQARDRDERLVAAGQADPQQISRRNGLFSALQPSQARLVRRRVEVRMA